MAGEASRLYEGWRLRILRAIAHIEGYIDFGTDNADMLSPILNADMPSTNCTQHTKRLANSNSMYNVLRTHMEKINGVKYIFFIDRCI